MKNNKILFRSILILVSLISCNNSNVKSKELEKSNTTKTLTQKEKDEEWIKKAKLIGNMKEGDTLDIIIPNSEKSQPKSQSDSKYLIDIERYLSEQNKKFENNEFWREEAYRATKNYINNGIIKKTNCKIKRQGVYNPINVGYIGNQTYLVKYYCEFDCKQGYNNPSNFWVEISYVGNNYWKGELIKQRFTD